MNKYLEKIAESLEDKDKSSPLKVMVMMGAASLPLHAAGAAIGHKLGTKFPGMALKVPESLASTTMPFMKKTVGEFADIDAPSLGQFVGSGVAGGIADYAVLKHEQRKNERNQ
jgi:hypothetical protein